MPFNTIISGQSVDALTAPRFQESYFSKVIHMPGKGVNEGLTRDINAPSVRVVRQKLPGIATRQLGATVNGGVFNSDSAKGIASDEFFIDITNMYDGNIDIAEVQEDMFSLPVVEATMDNCAGEVATGVNASTIAEQLAAVFNNAKREMVELPAEVTETAYRDAVLDASAVLDDGDPANGVQMYPDDMREIIARPRFCTGLFKGKNIIVGGDLSVALLERGVIAEGTYIGNGEQYVGEVNNTPIYKAPKVVWDAAAAEMVYATNGAPATAKASNFSNTATVKAELDKIDALVVSAVGTLRGIAVGNRIKSIPCPVGSGLRLQPKFRWGVKCIYPSSVVPIVGSTFDITKVVVEGKTVARLPVGSQQ